MGLSGSSSYLGKQSYFHFFNDHIGSLLFFSLLKYFFFSPRKLPNSENLLVESRYYFSKKRLPPLFIINVVHLNFLFLDFFLVI